MCPCHQIQEKLRWQIRKDKFTSHKDVDLVSDVGGSSTFHSQQIINDYIFYHSSHNDVSVVGNVQYDHTNVAFMSAYECSICMVFGMQSQKGIKIYASIG